jgi:hypothetical protein
LAVADRHSKRKTGESRIIGSPGRIFELIRKNPRITGLPDQTEILLQEVAILRAEVARLHSLIEQADESVRHLNVTLLERINTLMVLMQQLEGRLPPLPQ